MTSAAKKNDDTGNEAFADELAPGTSLLNGSYVIERFLNSGGFGITYLAKDSLDRSVVIKECFPGSFCRRSNTVVGARSRAHQAEFKSIVKLFVQEARSLSKLKHPNIVGVHQVFEDNDTAYMALDYVEGSDLLDIMDDGKTNLGPVEIQPILTKLLGAVSFIHDQGVLHRDISPDNILITDTDNPVLIDFGAAREEATKASRVLSALRVVKDGYSPQEFYIQGSDQSPSSDLYALGASFYHLINGETPPNSQNRLAAIAAGETDPYEPLAGRVEGYKEGFLEAIDKALNVFPKDRVQSADDWLAMINGTAVATPETSKTVVELAQKKPAVETNEPAQAAPVAAAPASEKSKTGILLGSAAAIAIIAALAAWQLSGGGDDVDTTANTAPAPESEVAADTPSDTAPVEPATEEADPQPAAEPEEVEQAQADQTTGDAPENIASDDVDAKITESEGTPEPVEDAPVVADDVVEPEPAQPELTQPEAAQPEQIVEAPQPVEAPEPVEVPEPVFDQTPPTVTSAFSRPAWRPKLGELGDVAAAPDADVEVNKASDLPDIDGNAGSQELASIDTTPATPTPIPFFEEEPSVRELSAVMSAWRVDVPVSEQGRSGTVVDNETAENIDWINAGQIITKVNGLRIKSLDQIGKVVESSAEFGQDQSIDAVISYRDSENGPDLEKLVSLDAQYEVELLNGTRFQTEFADDAWVTTVLSTQDNNPSGLLSDDIILSYIPTGAAITGPSTLGDIIEKELADGKTSFNFAVQRDGSTWLASMTYDAEISN